MQNVSPPPHLHTYTHLVALGAPEYTTTTHGPVTHIAQEEIHSAHNTVTQKVTEHTIHVLVICSDTIFIPTKYTDS